MAFIVNLTTSWLSSTLMRLGVMRDRSFHVIRPWGTWNSFVHVQDRRLIDSRWRTVSDERLLSLLLKSCYCFICQIASFRLQCRRRGVRERRKHNTIKSILVNCEIYVSTGRRFAILETLENAICAELLPPPPVSSVSWTDLSPEVDNARFVKRGGWRLSQPERTATFFSETDTVVLAYGQSSLSLPEEYRSATLFFLEVIVKAPSHPRD